jgi:hypothetical protein
MPSLSGLCGKATSIEARYVHIPIMGGATRLYEGVLPAKARQAYATIELCRMGFRSSLGIVTDLNAHTKENVIQSTG